MEGLGRLKPGGLDGLLVSLLGGGLFGLVGFALGFFRITQTQALNKPVVLDLLHIKDERLGGKLGQARIVGGKHHDDGGPALLGDAMRLVR